MRPLIVFFLLLTLSPAQLKIEPNAATTPNDGTVGLFDKRVLAIQEINVLHESIESDYLKMVDDLLTLHNADVDVVLVKNLTKIRVKYQRIKKISQETK